jgi:hypothetical protein
LTGKSIFNRIFAQNIFMFLTFWQAKKKQVDIFSLNLCRKEQPAGAGAAGLALCRLY